MTPKPTSKPGDDKPKPSHNKPDINNAMLHLSHSDDPETKED